MKKILAIAVIMMTSLSSAQAQEGIRLGAKGSYYSTWLFNKNVSDQNASLDYASSFSPSFGVQAIYMFRETYGVSLELIYASQNQKYDGYNNGNEIFAFENELNLSYLDIPILFRVSSTKGPYFEIGPQASLLMGAKETYTTVFTPTQNYSDKDVKDDFAGFGVAGILGFGVDIKLTDMVGLTTGLRFGYMFTDATSEYTESELNALNGIGGDTWNSMGAQSLVSNASSYEAEKHFTSNKNNVSYQKSNRAFGGLQIGVQIRLDK